MTAFDSGVNAIKCCLDLQITLLGESWPPEVLECPDACEEFKEDSDQQLGLTLVWRGLRAKCGVYEDVPTSVEPHKTTGRADYFGPLVNRAARLMGAACGGEVLAELPSVRKWQIQEPKWNWDRIG